MYCVQHVASAYSRCVTDWFPSRVARRFSTAFKPFSVCMSRISPTIMMARSSCDADLFMQTAAAPLRAAFHRWRLAATCKPESPLCSSCRAVQMPSVRCEQTALSAKDDDILEASLATCEVHEERRLRVAISRFLRNFVSTRIFNEHDTSENVTVHHFPNIETSIIKCCLTRSQRQWTWAMELYRVRGVREQDYKGCSPRKLAMLRRRPRSTTRRRFSALTATM